MSKTKTNIEPFLVSKYLWSKKKFNCSDIEHLKEYDFFLKQNKWGKNCPFELELPFTSIPQMIENKITNHYLDMMLKRSNGKS